MEHPICLRQVCIAGASVDPFIDDVMLVTSKIPYTRSDVKVRCLLSNIALNSLTYAGTNIEVHHGPLSVDLRGGKAHIRLEEIIRAA